MWRVLVSRWGSWKIGFGSEDKHLATTAEGKVVHRLQGVDLAMEGYEHHRQTRRRQQMCAEQFSAKPGKGKRRRDVFERSRKGRGRLPGCKQPKQSACKLKKGWLRKRRRQKRQSSSGSNLRRDLHAKSSSEKRKGSRRQPDRRPSDCAYGGRMEER